MTRQREITGWIMYDWANSAFATTVVTTFLGPYLAVLIAARPNGTLPIGPWQIEPAAFYPLCVSISVILQVLCLPFLGALADLTNLKKRLLLTFATIGAGATLMLGLVADGSQALLGGFLFIMANLAFGAAIVFYNAFLPDLAPPAQQDSVSARGFAFGYLGGGLLLGLNVLLFQLMRDQGLAVRLALSSAGLWWLVFTWAFPARRLRTSGASVPLPRPGQIISYTVRPLLRTLIEMKRRYPGTLRFLVAYLIYNDGIMTVNTVAAIFAASELGLGPDALVGIVLMIQFIAAIGALLFGRLAKRIGAKATVLITLAGWSGLLVYAFGWLNTPAQIWGWAAAEALVLGSSQALSRSVFAKMVPAGRESAYFSLYEISERGTSWIGPLVFALAVQQTNSARAALLPLIFFFLLGGLILATTNVRQAIADAGNEVPARV